MQELGACDARSTIMKTKPSQIPVIVGLVLCALVVTSLVYSAVTREHREIAAAGPCVDATAHMRRCVDAFCPGRVDDFNFCRFPDAGDVCAMPSISAQEINAILSMSCDQIVAGLAALDIARGH